jgi:hypothetical protein
VKLCVRAAIPCPFGARQRSRTYGLARLVDRTRGSDATNDRLYGRDGEKIRSHRMF